MNGTRLTTFKIASAAATVQQRICLSFQCGGEYRHQYDGGIIKNCYLELFDKILSDYVKFMLLRELNL